MADPYLITFDGVGHRPSYRDAWPAVRFRIKRGDSYFYFECTMTRQAAIGFRDFNAEQMEAILISAGLDELERRLRAGVFPPEEGSSDDVLFTSDQYEQLQAIADREKQCLWQERLPRGWICWRPSPAATSGQRRPFVQVAASRMRG